MPYEDWKKVKCPFSEACETFWDHSVSCSSGYDRKANDIAVTELSIQLWKAQIEHLTFEHKEVQESKRAEVLERLRVQARHHGRLAKGNGQYELKELPADIEELCGDLVNFELRSLTYTTIGVCI